MTPELGRILFWAMFPVAICLFVAMIWSRCEVEDDPDGCGCAPSDARR